MSFFYNLNTRVKLLCSFFTIIFINVIILVTSLNSMVYNRDVALVVNDVLISSFGRISRAQNAAASTNLSFIHALGNDSNYEVSDLKRDVNGLLAEMEAAVSKINPRHFNRSEYIEGCNQLISLSRNAIKVIEQQVIPVVQQGNNAQSLEYFLLNAAPIFAEISKNTMELIKIQHEECVKLTIPAANARPIYTILILAAVGSVIAVFLAFFIANYVANAIQEQIVILEKMAGGDFSFHITSGHNDEFGRTHIALRKMRTALNDIIVSTKKECTQLQHEMRSLQNLSSSIVSHSDDVETQAVTVSAASDEMVSTTQDIARNCDAAAHSSSICKDISDNGMQQVLLAVNSIREQSEHTKDNAQKIESLAKQTKEIGFIVSTIDDIAAQTNLLALNAAIEAARAGEAGRGFAVVADEVRALASRTTASTQKISKMIKNIQDEATLATESISMSVENMNAVAEKASDTERLLRDIMTHVGEVNTQITQIATAAEQQTSATSEISSNMQNITLATNTMTESANTQSTSMDAAYNDLEKLIKALSFFKTREGLTDRS